METLVAADMTDCWAGLHSDGVSEEPEPFTGCATGYWVTRKPMIALGLSILSNTQDPDRAEAAMRHHLKQVLKTIQELASEMPAIFA